MSTDLTFADLSRMLREGANRLKDNHALLSALDAATGDGDHGTTMKKVADAILDAVHGCQTKQVQSLLEAVGWNIMSVDGGSASPLLGSFFLGIAEGATAALLDGPAVASAFEKGLLKLRSQTPAQPGDKTMIDALEPAVTALRLAAEGGSSPADCFALAADSAEFGAQQTELFQAKYGRAKNVGARSIGHIDPGAMSISYLFAGFRDGLASAASAHA